MTYVGRFVAQAFHRRNPLGFQAGAGGFYYWLSREQADLGAVRQHVTSLEALPRSEPPKGVDAPPYIKYLGTSPLEE
ncbi:hypothetical protein [Caldimonas sp. KR1-144]|uniref:hypothetical protein n=1 Tax=Caldimonas sp. KR1-144 TaxID=3400911 RepID=UPI003C038454